MAQQRTARIGEDQAAALATEQGDPQPLLELLDPRGDIGGHTVQPVGRARHATLPYHAAEDMQVVQIHHSHLENCMLLKIQYSMQLRGCPMRAGR